MIRMIGIMFAALVWVGSAAAQGSYTFQTIDVPLAGAERTTITGINDKGELVGVFEDAQMITRSFLGSVANFRL
jgi:hypothetical protein